jgi:hypothetical protein
MFASEFKGFEAELPSAGHDPAAHVLQRPVLFKKTWVAGSSPATGTCRTLLGVPGIKYSKPDSSEGKPGFPLSRE